MCVGMLVRTTTKHSFTCAVRIRCQSRDCITTDDSDRKNDEQEARIAVLQHFASLMQGYKLYILTLVVGSVALIELWPKVCSFQLLGLVWALGCASVPGAMFYCILRIAFFGKFLELSYTASPIDGPWPMLNNVRRGVESSIADYLRSEGPRTWKARLWKRIVKSGETAYSGLPPSVIVTAIFAVILLLSWFYNIVSCVPGL